MSRSVATIAALSVLALSTAGPLSAQAEADGRGAGRLFVSGGVQVVDTEELNQLLESRGLPPLSDEHVTLGLGIDQQSGRWLLGGEAALLLAEEETGDGFERSLSGRYGLLEAGFVFPLADGLRVYPLAGLGRSDLDFTTTRDGSVAFDELLEGPGPGSEVSTGGWILQPGLGLDLVTGGFSVGVRGGYVFAPGEAEWEAEEITVEGGPDVGLEGFFVRATLGVAGR